MPCPLRARRPLTPQEADLARDHLHAAYEDCDGGGTLSLEVLAGVMGRQMATPFLDDREREEWAPVMRPLLYRTGAAAALTAACARNGVDPDVYLRLMDETAKAEAAIPAGV